MEAILEIKNLTKHFPIHGGILKRQIAKVHAVDDVSFSLQKGETLGLVGESGCGKSTLGRTILKLYPATSGKIIFQGLDITDLSHGQFKSIRKDIQIIFQDPFASLDPRMTVGDILEEPFRIHNMFDDKSTSNRIAQLLDLVGLHREAIYRYPHEFSGGQRQRIGIARAIALNPKVIICDEPVSALDVSIQAQILNLLKNLQKELGLTYIFIAHNLAVVKHISTRIAVMYLGQMIELGYSEQIHTNSQHPYTQALISAVPRVRPSQRTDKQILQGDVPSPITPPTGCRFHPRCPLAIDICQREVPKLVNISINGQAHWVACHLKTPEKRSFS